MELTLENLADRIELAESSLNATASSSATTSLSINQVTADQIALSFKGMPGNQPNTYGNFLSIWQNSNSIPWNQEPLKTQPVPNDTKDGDMVFTGLDVNNNSYIIGYSVGPVLTSPKQKYGNICTTAFVPAVGGNGELTGDDPNEFNPSLTIGHIGATSIAVDFKLPSGILPQTNGAWIGIFRASEASYNQAPEGKNNIQVDASDGSGFINDISIGRGKTYTVGLYLSGWGGGSSPDGQTALACSVTFTN